MTTHDIFVILNYLSVFVMLVCSTILFKHKASQMQKLASITSISLTVCCIGFLIRIEATNAEALIAGQKILYSFITYGMFFMLLFIFEYCNISIPKIITNICHILNLGVTVMVLTLDHHQLFYKSYWAVFVNDHWELEKEYSFGHSFVVGLFIFYMVAAFAVATYFSARNIKKRADYVAFIMIAVTLPCLSYVIPKITGLDNDFQPIAFALFTVMTLIMIYKNNLYDINNIAAEYSIESMEYGLIVLDKKGGYKGCNETARKIIPELANLSIDAKLGEMPLLQDFLDGKYEYYDVGDKKYSVNAKEIDDADGEKGRVIWLEDVTVEFKYNEMMKLQQENLKNEVVRLNDISYRDELTGIYNRRYYEECIAKYRSTADTSGIIILSLDLNGLKKANDELGHAAGDELIIEAAKLMEANFGSYGKCYRSGGDEFFVIIDSKGPVEGITAGDLDKTPGNFSCPEGARKALEPMLEKFDKEVNSWHGKLVGSMNIAYGIVIGSENEGKTIDELMIMADQSMYVSKEQYYVESGVKKYR